jgi:hypothetical protein
MIPCFFRQKGSKVEDALEEMSEDKNQNNRGYNYAIQADRSEEHDD